MRRLNWILIGATLMMGCSGFHHGPRKDRIAVIAHRGASHDAPENTLAAFTLAARMKADWAELDCQLSRDGEVIVAHDATLDRTTNAKGAIVDRTWAELEPLDAGSWMDPRFAGERIPSLRQALEQSRRDRIGLYIEIKDANKKKNVALEDRILELAAGRVIADDPALSRQVIRAIEESGTPNVELTRKTVALVRQTRRQKQVVIQSFSPIVCALVALEAPELRIEFLFRDKPKTPAAWEKDMSLARVLGLDGCNLSRSLITPERVAAIHGERRTVAIWVADTEEEIRRYAGMGVDGIITNRPDLCRRVLETLGKR